MGELNIDNESIILLNYNLSPNELYAIKCILYYIDGHKEYFKRYMKLPESLRGNLIDLLEGLKKKHIVCVNSKIKFNKEDYDSLGTVKFNSSFTNGYYRASRELGEELYRIYPSSTWIDGIETPLRTVAAKFNSLEEAFDRYAKDIHNNNETHKEVLKIVNWAKTNDRLNMSLGSFIVNNSWLDLKEIKDGKVGNYNPDCIRLI